MQNLSQRSDVPFHRGTEKLMKERKTKHDWLKKTNLIVSLDRTRTSFSEPRILSPVRLPVPPPRPVVELVVYAVCFSLAAVLSPRFVPTT